MFNFKHGKIILWTVLLAAAAFFFIFPSHKMLNGQSETLPPAVEEGMVEELKLFSKALGVILEAYPEDLEKREMLYRAVRGMVNSLDKFSEFIEPERYELLQIHMRGEYAGIGAILDQFEGFPVIRAVQPGSAAEKAGLQSKDMILTVNGNSMHGLEIPEVSKLLRGEEGTALMMTVRRLLTGEVFDAEIVREKIELTSVEDFHMIGKSIGYLKITSWQDNTVEQFDKGIGILSKQGMRALILDLRNNDGGLMPKAVELSARFLGPGKKVVSVMSKIEEQKKEHFTETAIPPLDYPLIILVNEVSASASEIFSAAMQDYGRAKIVGIQTFGKASVQSVIPLDEESAMKLTTAKYVSPNGRDINHVGIAPDVVIVNELGGQPDLQLLKAIDLLKEFM